MHHCTQQNKLDIGGSVDNGALDTIDKKITKKTTNQAGQG